MVKNKIKMLLTVVLIVIILIILLVYLVGIYNETYWKRRGVAFYTKNKVLGPFWDLGTQDRSLFQIYDQIYQDYRQEPAVGTGSLYNPALCLLDLRNVHHVFQTDFTSFSRRVFDPSKEDKLAHNLLFLNGVEWKLVRQSMTPLFTAAKLKNMYYIVDRSARDFVDSLKSNPVQLRGNLYDTLCSFCSAAITAAVFGITTESIFHSPFLDVAKNSIASGSLMNLKFALINVCPSLASGLGLKMFTQFEELFLGAIKKVIRQRENETERRHDFADICVGLQKSGVIKDAESGYELEPTDELLAAQAFFFYIAGVEPCAIALFGTIIELGRNPDILRRVHEEIDGTFKKYGNEITYDALSEAKYIDKVLAEGLRMYPPITTLGRQCTQDTTLPVGNIKVSKGTMITVPVHSIHRDPLYYPNPNTFDPERFSQESKVPESIYLSFGKGKRSCVGARFGLLQIKTCMVHVLRHFTIKTHVLEGGIKYKKDCLMLRPCNVDVEFLPRNI